MSPITATATDLDAADVLTITQSGMPTDLVFTHTPAQSVCPAGQWHAPEEQVVPAGHAVPLLRARGAAAPGEESLRPAVRDVVDCLENLNGIPSNRAALSTSDIRRRAKGPPADFQWPMSPLVTETNLT